jgi:hypothetical protein
MFQVGHFIMTTHILSIFRKHNIKFSCSFQILNLFQLSSYCHIEIFIIQGFNTYKVPACSCVNK